MEIKTAVATWQAHGGRAGGGRGAAVDWQQMGRGLSTILCSHWSESCHVTSSECKWKELPRPAPALLFRCRWSAPSSAWRIQRATSQKWCRISGKTASESGQREEPAYEGLRLTVRRRPARSLARGVTVGYVGSVTVCVCVVCRNAWGYSVALANVLSGPQNSSKDSSPCL